MWKTFFVETIGSYCSSFQLIIFEDMLMTLGAPLPFFCHNFETKRSIVWPYIYIYYTHTHKKSAFCKSEKLFSQDVFACVCTHFQCWHNTFVSLVQLVCAGPPPSLAWLCWHMNSCRGGSILTLEDSKLFLFLNPNDNYCNKIPNHASTVVGASCEIHTVISGL